MLPAVLSLIVPGLGQAYLGQWARGIRVFGASATLCFGLGIANVLVAYDAYSLAMRRREQDILPRTSSKSLLVFALLWKGVMAALDGVVDVFLGTPSIFMWAVASPLMLASLLGGGKGFRWS